MIDGNALEQKHAQFLVLHLRRMLRDSAPPDVAGAAQRVLDELLATYPELRPAHERDPFAGLEDA